MLVNNVGDCSCSDYKSSSGFGNCEKDVVLNNVARKICYVNLPTTCSDVRESETEPGKKFAWEPCEGKNYLYT